MNVAAIPMGAAVFLDANPIIYHFANHPQFGHACTRLFERIENKELSGYTSSHCLGDAVHRIMTLEAQQMMGWSMTRLAARLKSHHAIIPALTQFAQIPLRLGQMNVSVIPVTNHDVDTALSMSHRFELLTGDALVVAVMHAHGLKNIASEDHDFDRVAGLTRYSLS